MYGPDLVALFERAKDVWDPDDLLNPGMLVRPARLDENLRFAVLPREPVDVVFGYPADGGDFSAAVRRCVGVAKCRTTAVSGAGVMCPSFRATGAEEHSTRGRARLLHEMLAGEVVTDGWRSTEVRDALDLCLSCKGCRTDCPVGVDMATYKAEFLHHHYAGRRRPAAHYAMGWLPVWLGAVARTRTAPLFNARVRPAAGGAGQAAGRDRPRARDPPARADVHPMVAAGVRRAGAGEDRDGRRFACRPVAGHLHGASVAVRGQGGRTGAGGGGSGRGSAARGARGRGGPPARDRGQAGAGSAAV